MEERSKLQKAVLISMAAMVVLFGILTLISHVRKGVEFEGGLLRRTETEESVIYNGKVRGEQVEITVRAAGSGNLTEVDFRIGNRIQDDCTLETGLPPIQAEQLGPVEHIRITKNDSLLFEGGYDPEYGMGWYDLDGNWDPFTMSVSYSSTAGDDYWEHYETDRGTILSFARGPQLVSRGSWELYFAMLLLSALLALDAAFPLVIFHWQRMIFIYRFRWLKKALQQNTSQEGIRRSYILVVMLRGLVRTKQLLVIVPMRRYSSSRNV